jgi:hypothetical protein
MCACFGPSLALYSSEKPYRPLSFWLLPDRFSACTSISVRPANGLRGIAGQQLLKAETFSEVCINSAQTKTPAGAGVSAELTNF